MLIVLSVAAAAALVVAAYNKLQQHSPEAVTTGLRAVRDLADVVIVCVKAIEGIVDVLSRSTLPSLSVPQNWSTDDPDEPWDEHGFDDERI